MLYHLTRSSLHSDVLNSLSFVLTKNCSKKYFLFRSCSFFLNLNVFSQVFKLKNFNHFCILHQFVKVHRVIYLLGSLLLFYRLNSEFRLLAVFLVKMTKGSEHQYSNQIQVIVLVYCCFSHNILVDSGKYFLILQNHLRKIQKISFLIPQFHRYLYPVFNLLTNQIQ